MSSSQFRLGEEIGRGALGRVVRVHDEGAGVVYAGKILHESHQGDEQARARFESESGILATIDAPNIVRVYGIEDIDDESVMRMELVEGPSLATLIAREAPLPFERVLHIAKGLVAGLRAAHAAGLVHRDLKPQNILLSADDAVKIADFGLARAASFAGVDQDAFAVAGTPDYMAPESLDPLAVDARSDLYSLGCILFEMVRGHPPYQGPTAFAVLEAHQREPVPELPSELPVALANMIRELLAKSPADRVQSAAALCDELEAMGQDPKQALALRSDAALAVQGQCAGCSQKLLPDVPICFACQRPSVSVADGKHTLFVVGPGEIGDKLDTVLRQSLLDWMSANPALGLDPKRLARSVPRMPFVFAPRIDLESARGIKSALESLGLQCAIEKGGALALPAVHKKSWLLTRRIMLIIAASSVGTVNAIGHFYLPAVSTVLVGGMGAGWLSSVRSVTRRRKSKTRSLPTPVSQSLARLTPVVADMEAKRHRENLRAVVERVLALCDTMAREELSRNDSDLARLLDLALLATSRMSEIDSGLADADMRNPSEVTLALLRERDQLAGRLLELTAFVDSMRIRHAALRHTGDGTLDESRLDELHAQMDALEEVQAL